MNDPQLAETNVMLVSIAMFDIHGGDKMKEVYTANLQCAPATCFKALAVVWWGEN